MGICRICLGSKPRKDISQLDVSYNGIKVTYTDIMLFCLGIQVKEDSKISTKLCVKCYRKIIEYHQFKTLALKNEAFLISTTTKKDEIATLIKEDDIKTEQLSLGSDHQDFDDDPEVVLDIKQECKDDESDNELLSTLKKIKYEAPDSWEKSIKTEGTSIRNANIKSKRIRVRTIKSQVCEECGKSVKDLKKHLQLHLPPSERKKYKCHLCDKLFFTHNSKIKHVNRKHLGIKKQCKICGKIVANLRQHEQIVHEKESLPFQCGFCGMKFLCQSRLDTHIAVHSDDRPFQCDICEAKFRYKQRVELHKKQVHDKEKLHLCHLCSKSFFKKYHLQLHIRSHTKEKPYACQKCKKAFASSGQLKNHLYIHATERNFACSLCDLTFKRPAYLRAHMLSHVKDKKFPCSFCGIRFHRSDHRKRHEFTAHLRHSISNTAA